MKIKSIFILIMGFHLFSSCFINPYTVILRNFWNHIDKRYLLSGHTKINQVSSKLRSLSIIDLLLSTFLSILTDGRMDGRTKISIEVYIRA